jgi:hypothetical protein
MDKKCHHFIVGIVLRTKELNPLQSYTTPIEPLVPIKGVITAGDRAISANPTETPRHAPNLSIINNLQRVTSERIEPENTRRALKTDFRADKSFVFNVLSLWHRNCSPSTPLAKL